MCLSNSIKKIIIFLVWGLFLSTGQCLAEYNLATKEEEHLFISTASEVKLGGNLAQKVESRYKLSSDPKLQERIQQIGKKLAAVCDRKDITYYFTVLDSEEVNAFALPGGYIYVHRGLIEKADSDDEIAAALAHEIGHIVARHSVKRLQASLGYNLLSILAVAASKDLRFKRGADLAFYQIMLGYSKEDELLADKLSVKYLQKCGYNPEAIISFLNKLKQIEKEAPLRPLVTKLYRTHPYLPERIALVKQEVRGKMDFNDYINRSNLDN